MTVPNKGRRVTPAEHMQAQMIAREQRAIERRQRDAESREWARERAKYKIPPHDPAFAYVTQKIGDDIESGCYPIANPQIYKGRVEIHLAKWHALQTRQPDYVVYYIRVGKYIKIGTTKDVDRRLNQYPPDSELLATEPGGHNIEAMRHKQFRQYLAARNEWFEPGERLMWYIEHLQKSAVAELRRAQSGVSDLTTEGH